MIFERSSFWAGLLTASLPISVVAKSLVGSMLSIVVLGESMKHTHTRLCLLREFCWLSSRPWRGPWRGCIYIEEGCRETLQKNVGG